MRRLKGWTIRLKPDSTEGYCWQKQKIIDLGLSSDNPLRLLLHEVAHIGVKHSDRNYHNQKWFNEFLALMQKYMPGIDISKSDKIIQKCNSLRGDRK